MNGRRITGIILVVLGAAVAIVGVLYNDGSGTLGPIIGAVLIAAGISYGQLGKKPKPVNIEHAAACREDLPPRPEPVCHDSVPTNQPPKTKKAGSEKPIYKKWWFWLIILIFVGNLYNRVSASIHEKQLTDPAYIAKTLDIDKACGIALLDAERKIGIDPNGVSDYFNSGSECRFSYNGYTFAVVISDNKIKSIRCGTMLFFKNGAALDDVKTRLISLDQMVCLQSAAKKALEGILKSPSTAHYPGEGKYNSFDGWNFLRDGDTFTVSSYVDAQNSFGAVIRSDFTVTIAWNGNKNNNPKPENVLFDGKSYAID